MIINDGGGSSKPKSTPPSPPPKTDTTPSTSSTQSSSSSSSAGSTKPKEHKPDEGVDNTPSSTSTTSTEDDAFDWSSKAKEEAGVEEETGTEQTDETNQTTQAEEAAAAEETGPPDFSKMTEQEQYDYLHNLVVQQAGGDESAWKSGEGEVNIIGIRSYTDGQPTTPEGNRYNDTIYVVRMVDGQPQVDAFHGSTDAGIFADPQGSGFGYSEGGEYKGISHLADGFYQDTWVKGPVPVTDLGGLRQAADIQIHADSNNNGVIEANEQLGANGEGVTVGAGWGIQFHPGGNGENVGNWSAGCQVIRGNEYAQFAEIVKNAPNERFSYLLIDGSNLPPVGSNMAAAGTGGNQGAGQAGGQGGPTTTPAAPQPTNQTLATNEPVAVQTPAQTNNNNQVNQANEAQEPAQAQEAPAAEPEPYRPRPMPSNMANRDVTSAMDQQLQVLISQAQWEVENGQKQGPGVLALAEWYKMANMTKMPISTETRKLVTEILDKAGISIAQPQQAKPVYTFNMGSPLAALMNQNRQV